MPNAQGTEQGGSKSAEGKESGARHVKAAAAGKTATGPEWVGPLTFNPELRPTAGPGKVQLDRIDKEWDAALARGRTSSVDEPTIRTRKAELIGLLLEGGKHVDAEGRPYVEAFHWALHYGFVQLAEAIHLHKTVPTGAHRYLVGAWRATAAAYPEVSGLRDDVRERLGTDPATAELRRRSGVGGHLSARLPLEVLDTGRSQVKVLEDPVLAEVLLEAGIEPERRLRKLKPLLATLDAEIEKGTGVELKKGGATDLEDAALLYLDIVCSRIPVFLRDYGRREDAQRFAERVPHRTARTTKKAEEETPQDGTQTPAPEAKPAPKGKRAKAKAEAEAKAAAEAKAKAEAEAKAAAEAQAKAKAESEAKAAAEAKAKAEADKVVPAQPVTPAA